MKKESQKRSLLQRLYESANVGGLMMEELSPNVQELMDNLRGADNTVRELAAGGGNGLSLKELLKASKKSLNDARYLQAVGYLGSFYNRLEDINKEFSRIKGLAEKEHLDFLSKGLDDDGREHLLNLHKKHATECSSLGINKFAGLFNLFSGFKSWEKLNPSFTKELKNSIFDHFRAAEKVYNLFSAILKEMGSLRASRKIEGYLKAIEKISKAYLPAKTAFENFYKTKIKSFVDKIQEASNIKPVETTNPSEKVITEVTEDKSPPIQKAFPNWGKSLPESKTETQPANIKDDKETNNPTITSTVKTEPMPVSKEITVEEEEEEEVETKPEPEVKAPVVTQPEVKAPVVTQHQVKVPEVKKTEEKPPQLTVPGSKPLKPPKKNKNDELEAALEAFNNRHKTEASFNMQKRNVILKKAIA